MFELAPTHGSFDAWPEQLTRRDTRLDRAIGTDGLPVQVGSAEPVARPTRRELFALPKGHPWTFRTGSRTVQEARSCTRWRRRPDDAFRAVVLGCVSQVATVGNLKRSLSPPATVMSALRLSAARLGE